MSEYPEYHEQAMGCGLEDQNITNRYEACRYGYETALEDVNNDIVEPLEKENQELKDQLEQSEVDRKSATLQCESMRKDQNTLSAVEKENKELREERQELAESMLNIIGIVRRVSGDAYRCINHKFIDRLEKLEGGE